MLAESVAFDSLGVSDASFWATPSYEVACICRSLLHNADYGGMVPYPFGELGAVTSRQIGSETERTYLCR